MTGLGGSFKLNRNSKMICETIQISCLKINKYFSTECYKDISNSEITFLTDHGRRSRYG